MNRLRPKLTYSNVISTVCLFLLLGGGTAFAASHLGKSSVGTKQLKANAVTAAKLKNGAITAAKIAPGAIDASKLAPGVIPAGGASVAAPPTVPAAPAPAPTSEAVKGAAGELVVGQQATVFEHGPFAITAKCEEPEAGRVNERILISSSTPGSVFASSGEGSSHLGPESTEAERELIGRLQALSTGGFNYLGPATIAVSALSADGQSAFDAWLAEGTEADSHSCWYWVTADVIR